MFTSPHNRTPTIPWTDSAPVFVTATIVFMADRKTVACSLVCTAKTALSSI